MDISSSYLHEALRSPVTSACYVISKLRDMPFGFVAFKGMSGALVGPLVAANYDKPVAIVRDLDSSSHSSQLVEGPRLLPSYIIVDDMISSGHTVRVIMKRIKEINPHAKCKGIYLYMNPSFLSSYGKEIDGIPIIQCHPEFEDDEDDDN